MIKNIFVGILIFAFFLTLGGIFRYFWLFKHQKAIFEKKYIYKEWVESKLGGKTPQETWNLYLDALEKEDIDLAIQYFVPEGREGVKKVMIERKQAGVLQRYAKNHSRKLQEIKNPQKYLENNEKIFTHKYIEDKFVDFADLEAASKEYQESTKSYWEQQKSDLVETQDDVIFKLNKYSNKWLIKE